MGAFTLTGTQASESKEQEEKDMDDQSFLRGDKAGTGDGATGDAFGVFPRMSPLSDSSEFRRSRAGIEPKDQEVHIQAARSNDAARARAFATLSTAEIRFGLIGEALREICAIEKPAAMGDFPSVALEEAATAFQHQLSGLLILLASAKVHTGARHALVSTYFSDRFDEMGADLIRDGAFIFEADPVQLALGCYPILQIALHMYYDFHAPIELAVSPLVELARQVKLIKNSLFSPARGLDAFFTAHAQARRDKVDYDASAVYGHLVNAINQASAVSYEYYPTNGDPPVPWRAWAMKVIRDHQAHLLLGGPAAGYVMRDVNNLRDGLRRFAMAHDREQTSRELGAVHGAAYVTVTVDDGPISDPALGVAVDHGSISDPTPGTVGAVLEVPVPAPARELTVGARSPAPLPVLAPISAAAGGAPGATWAFDAHEDDGPAIGPLAPPPPKKGARVGKGGRGKGGKGAQAKGTRGRDGGQGHRPAPAPPPSAVHIATLAPSAAGVLLQARAAPNLLLGLRPVHVSVACTVCDSSANLLSLAAMLQAGWCFAWTPRGHFLEVPGVQRFPLRSENSGNLAYIDVVLVPGTEHDPKVTLFNPEDPAQADLPRHAFLVDTGADHSLVKPDKACLLARPGSFPGVYCTGISGGAALPILGAGYLDFVFPGFLRGQTGFWGGCLINDINRTTVAAPLVKASVHIVSRDTHRPSACAPIMSAKQAAERFNLFDHDALANFHLVVNGVAPFPVDRKHDYSNGLLQRAMGRRAPTHTTLNQLTMEIREHIPNGHTWWTDISHPHTPDFAGNRYTRTFAEQNTGRVRLTFSARKDTQSLLRDLENMRMWVLMNVPGGQFRCLGCDFGSEYAQQGHGNNVLVQALREYCADHPGFVVTPLSPYDQAHNLAENAIKQTSGLAFANACRARLGPAAWSLTELGAEFQHNHRSAYRANDESMRDITRDEALTGRIFDASTFIGWNGQPCWAHDESGKANMFRPNARPCLYVCPSDEARGQVYFDLDRNKLNIGRALSMSNDPDAVPYVLAVSDLSSPQGSVGRPDPSAYTKRVRSMLMPGVDPTNIMVANDPVTGDASYVYAILPYIDTTSGDIVMLPVHTVANEGGGSPGVAPAGAAEGSLAAPITVLAGTITAGAAAAAPPPPLRQRDPLEMPDMAAEEAESALSIRVDTLGIESVPLDTVLWFNKDAKAGPPGKAPSKSRLRLQLYAAATTMAEFYILHPGTRVQAQRDFAWDATRGIVRAPAMLWPDPAPVARAVRWSPEAVAAASRRRRARFVDHVRDVRAYAWEREFEERLHAHRRDMDIVAAHRKELDRLDGLEEVPTAHLAGSDFLGAPLEGFADPRRSVPAYTRAEAAARAGVATDYGDLSDLEGVVPAFGPAFDIPPAAVIFAASGPRDDDVPPDMRPPLLPGAAPRGVDPRLVPPVNIRAARLRDDYRGEFGWEAAMRKEVNRVCGFKAWRLVSISHMRDAQRRYGEDRVHQGYIVSVLSCKADPSGDPRGGGVTNKFRLAVAESKTAVFAEGKTYSSCSDDVSNRVITAIGPTLDAHQTSIDVGGAYYFGTPPSMDEGGRMLYAPVPEWLADFGEFPTHDKSGRRNMLLIQGNMPGRADAGVIWQKRFNTFLLAYGLRQLVTDRRVWVMHSDRGILIIHDHVDDSRLTSTTAAARSHFYLAWAAEFNSAPESAELSENFTGLKHEVLDGLRTRISCGAVMRSLVDLVEPFQSKFSRSVPQTPLPHDALRNLLRPSVPAQAVLDLTLLPYAQKIAGTIGFIVNSVRPDAYFAYCVLATYVNELKINEMVFRLILRVARYLIHSAHLSLTLNSEPRAEGVARQGLDLCTVYVDSSHGNAPEGRSYGGFILMCNRGGALAWKCAAPSAGDDSTGAAELRMGSLAYKYTLALRTLQRDLDVGVAPTRPTELFTDAQALIDGTGCERLSKSSRWMATRYAMIRWGLSCGTIELAKVPAEDNCADIVTKCLTGALFFKHRARILGLVGAEAAPPASY